VLLIADVLDAGARYVLDPLDHMSGAPDLAADDDAVGGRKGLAGDARMRILGQEGVKHGIGNAVADLVRVPFRNALGSEDEVLSGHEVLHWGYPRHARKPL